MTVQEAYELAAGIIAQAKNGAFNNRSAAFADFIRKHGAIERREENDYEHHGDNWCRMKTYTAEDGAHFYEVTQFPSTDMGLRVEYWSDDFKSIITYL